MQVWKAQAPEEEGVEGHMYPKIILIPRYYSLM